VPHSALWTAASTASRECPTPGSSSPWASRRANEPRPVAAKHRCQHRLSSPGVTGSAPITVGQIGPARQSHTPYPAVRNTGGSENIGPARDCAGRIAFGASALEIDVRIVGQLEHGDPRGSHASGVRSSRATVALAHPVTFRQRPGRFRRRGRQIPAAIGLGVTTDNSGVCRTRYRFDAHSLIVGTDE
jgi:hypothetical protein